MNRPTFPAEPQVTEFSRAKVSPAELPPRLLSLDTYRGLIMWSLAASGLGIAATAGNLGYAPDAEVSNLTGRVWQWLAFHNNHPFWNSQFWLVGCSYWDLIQPSFMFMVGVAMPYSYASRRRRGQSSRSLTIHAFWRALALVAIGFFLHTRTTGLDNTKLFTNVLAQIGLGYFFVFLLLDRSAKVQIAVGVLTLVAYWACFMSYPVPEPLPKSAVESIADLHVPTEVAKQFALNANFATYFDMQLFRLFPHSDPLEPHAAGYATLNFIPSAVTILLGVLAGTLLQSGRDEHEKLRWLILGGLGCMLAAVALSFTLCPIVKKIWTPAWTLYSGAWVLWILAALYWAIDVRGWKGWTFPLVVVGMNSLAIYLMAQLLKGSVRDAWEVYFGNEIFAGAYGPMLEAVAIFAVFWLACYYFYRNRIFFRL